MHDRVAVGSRGYGEYWSRNRFLTVFVSEMGMKWFQHPDTQVPNHTTQFTDVRQFLQESSLTLEVDAEMEAVADTFRGAENPHHGVRHWEGSSGNQQAKNGQKRHKHVVEAHNRVDNFQLAHACPNSISSWQIGALLCVVHAGRYTESLSNIANDHTFRANPILQDATPVRINISNADNWVKLGESQRTRVLSYLWKILPQRTTSSKHSVELIEFARDLGNSNSTLQTQ